MRRLAVLLIGLLATGVASALDYRSVVEAALLYDAPSQQAKPLFAIARGTPVESVVTLDAWVKVRDAKGDLAWIERRQLSDKRTVLVRTDRAQARSQADERAAMVFEADRDVVLELLDAGPAGWARVKHRDGQQGYVKALQVWGL
jgi:SH3-like domain-containing protein